jgi:hypothetical protein
MTDHANNFSQDAPHAVGGEPGQGPRGLAPHPLFPRRDRSPEDRDIRFVTFRRRLPNGRIEHCPEDIPAHEIQSWAQVTEVWGGGEYQVIGKDQLRQEVACHPLQNGEWILFNQEIRPFLPRSGLHHGASPNSFAPPYGQAMPAPGPYGHAAPANSFAPPYGQAMPAPGPYAAPANSFAPPYGQAMPAPGPYGHAAPANSFAPPYYGHAPPPPHAAPEQPPALVNAHGAHGPPQYAPPYAHGMPAQAPSYAPAAATAPAAPTGLEAQVAALGAHVVELAREVHASRTVPPAAAAPPPAAATAPNENILIAMINAQAQTSRDFQTQMQAAATRESENMRAMMTAMFTQRGVEAKPGVDPSANALTMIKAAKEIAQPASPVADTIANLKALKELTAPAAPAAPGSEISEIFTGITAMMQAEASKAAVASATEQTRQPPPEPPPPPRPRRVGRVPGVGVVEVLEPEVPTLSPASLPAHTSNGIDIEAIKRDPALRAKVLAELGLDASAVAPAPPPSSPGLATPPAPSTSSPLPMSPSAPMPTAPPVPSMSSAPAAPMPMPNAPPASPASPPSPVPIAPPATPVVASALPVPSALPAASASPATPSAPVVTTPLPAVEAPPGLPPIVVSTASSAPAPTAPPTEPSAPAPVVVARDLSAPAPAAAAQPTPSAPTQAATVPVPTAPPSGPPELIAVAASDDQRAPVVEPAQTAARGSPVVTEEYRMRAIPSLRTIASMPRDQQRAVLSTLPGLGDEEEVNKVLEFFQVAAAMPPELWGHMTAGLPADTVRALVDGPGG